MSQENVEIFRRIIEAANVADPEAILGPLLASSFRIENAPTAVTDNTYHGVQGTVAWRNDLAEGFTQGARFEVEAVLADTEDSVVARLALVGTGAHSGAPLHLRWMAVMWFHDGKATRGVGYASRHEALEAVGLRE
jgi:ketosteroid isomerase-like protein